MRDIEITSEIELEEKEREEMGKETGTRAEKERGG